ncbi:MAG: GerMN domain-containing protein [Candidatus Eremiobacteraeota bacterium]|nr:GerMN domain-containing protein [Candidatus Eremiobacteraeota bacterium]
MRGPRLPLLILLLVLVAAAGWYWFSHQPQRGGTIALYFTKQDGSSLGKIPVSMRPRRTDESASEYREETARYAAIQAVAGPPNDILAIRFPPGTHVRALSLDGSVARVDLSDDVERQTGGSFAETGEFKALVFTLTAIPGIDAVQVTVNGARVSALPGGNLELDQPLRRADW